MDECMDECTAACMDVWIVSIKKLLVDTAGASGPAVEALSYKECKCQSLQEMCVGVRSKAMEINEWMDAWMVLPAVCCLLVAACCLHMLS